MGGLDVDGGDEGPSSLRLAMTTEVMERSTSVRHNHLGAVATAACTGVLRALARSTRLTVGIFRCWQVSTSVCGVCGNIRGSTAVTRGQMKCAPSSKMRLSSGLNKLPSASPIGPFNADPRSQA